MRIANHLGAALVALCVVGLSGAPAMAETSDVTMAAATDAGVPDADVADADVPDADVPDADVEDAGVPDAIVPDADAPDLQETTEGPEEVDPTPELDILTDEAPPGRALPTPGCKFGTKDKKWSAVKKPWAVTHAKGYENLTGGTATYTKQATWQRTLEATASWTGEGGASANALIAQLEGKTGTTLALKGARTDSTSESVTGTMSPNRVFIFYAGARKTTGTLTAYVCNSKTMVPVGKGSVRSFGQKREGAVRCGAIVGKSTLGYIAQREQC